MLSMRCWTPQSISFSRQHRSPHITQKQALPTANLCPCCHDSLTRLFQSIAYSHLESRSSSASISSSGSHNGQLYNTHAHEPTVRTGTLDYRGEYRLYLQIPEPDVGYCYSDTDGEYICSVVSLSNLGPLGLFARNLPSIIQVLHLLF